MIKDLIKKILNIIIFSYFKSLFSKRIKALDKFCSLRNINKVFVLFEGGFGHTISETSIIENYEEKDCCFVFFYQKRRFHNKFIKILNFKKVKIFYFEIPYLPKNYWDISISKKILDLIKNNLLNKDVRTFEKLEKKIKKEHQISSKLDLSDIHWYRKKHKFDIKKNFKILIENSLNKKFNPKKKFNKILVSLRYKVDNDLSSQDRNGYNNLKNYLKLLEYLAIKDNIILLYCDFKLSKKEVFFLRKYKNIIFSDQCINLSKDLLYLYFSTNSNYVVTESGGGLVLPSLSERKILSINCWPMKHITPNSLILFKHIYDHKKQKLLDISEMISNKCFYKGDYDLKKNGFSLINNSSYEILNSFIELENKKKIYLNKNYRNFHKFSWSYANKNFLLSKSRKLKI